MNRDILFRGKRLDNGEWVFGDLMTKYPHHEGLTIVEHGCVYHEVDPKTVGQYTGMTDESKSKIFEGDLYRSNWGYIFEVVYLESEACFVGVPVGYPKEWTFLEDMLLDVKKVGNKWDNPELLGVD